MPDASGKTPGQLACEAYGSDRWANVGSVRRELWEAAAAAGAAGAHERTAELLTELNRVTAERDEARALLAEIFTTLDGDPVHGVTVRWWRERAGITDAGLPRRMPGATLREEAPS